MKRISFIILLLGKVSYAQEPPPTPEKGEFTKNENEKFYEQQKKFWDEDCEEGTQQARQDIKNGILKFPHYLGMVQKIEGVEELKTLLKKHNIEMIDVLTYCTVPYTKETCYGGEMLIEIKRKFGEKFIDSLENFAAEKYLQNNIDKIFEIEDCDLLPRRDYPNENVTYNEAIHRASDDFFKTFKYPADYVPRKENDYYSYSDAKFIIYKDGSISDLFVDTKLQNPENKKYTEDFSKKMKKFILKTKWKPATKRGIPVNSKWSIVVSYK